MGSLLPMGNPGAFGLEQGEGQGEARIDWAAHMEGQPPSEVKVGLADVYFAFEYELIWQARPYDLLNDGPSRVGLNQMRMNGLL